MENFHVHRSFFLQHQYWKFNFLCDSACWRGFSMCSFLQMICLWEQLAGGLPASSWCVEGRCAELLPKETSSKIDAAAAEGGPGLLARGCHSSVDFLKDEQELNLIWVSKQLEFRRFYCQVEFLWDEDLSFDSGFCFHRQSPLTISGSSGAVQKPSSASSRSAASGTANRCVMWP